MRKADVRTFAICYAAYLEALNKRDLSGVVTWGEMLQDVQRKLKVYVRDERHLQDMIDCYREMKERQNDIDAAVQPNHEELRQWPTL